MILSITGYFLWVFSIAKDPDYRACRVVPIVYLGNGVRGDVSLAASVLLTSIVYT